MMMVMVMMMMGRRGNIPNPENECPINNTRDRWVVPRKWDVALYTIHIINNKRKNDDEKTILFHNQGFMAFSSNSQGNLHTEYSQIQKLTSPPLYFGEKKSRLQENGLTCLTSP